MQITLKTQRFFQLGLLTLLALLVCQPPSHSLYLVHYTTNNGPKTTVGGDTGNTNLDGYDDEPMQDTSRQDWIYASFWHESGANGWAGPTGYYYADDRGPLAAGSTKIVEGLYMWAGTQVPEQSMVLLMDTQPFFTPNIASYKLRLVSVPAGVTYNGPYVWYGHHGPITLPYYATADGTTGYRFQAEISTVTRARFLCCACHVPRGDGGAASAEKAGGVRSTKGAFVISQLPTGTYRLTVAASGYVSRSDIQITVNGTGRYSAGSIALQAQ